MTEKEIQILQLENEMLRSENERLLNGAFGAAISRIKEVEDGMTAEIELSGASEALQKRIIAPLIMAAIKEQGAENFIGFRCDFPETNNAEPLYIVIGKANGKTPYEKYCEQTQKLEHIVNELKEIQDTNPKIARIISEFGS